jgi:hypothetical protein
VGELKELPTNQPTFSWVWLWRSLRPDLVWAGFGFGTLGLTGSVIARPGGLFESLSSCLTVTSIFLFCHLAATFFHYLPRGAEQGLARLSLAAFCRTFLPLLALLTVHHYIFPLVDGSNLAGICTTYLLSLGLTFVSALRGPADD